MSNIRHRIENGFSLFATVIYRHRLKTLLVIGVLVASLFSQLPRLRLDTSMEGFLHENDQAMVTYNNFRDQFGRDEVIIVALHPTEVFSIDFLNTLKEIHTAIEDQVPHIDDITSLINARNTRGQGDELIVEDLLEKWPRNDAELKDIKQRAMANEMYRNMLLSEDGSFTTIIVRTQARSSAVDDQEVMDGFEDDAPTSGPVNGGYLTDAENTAVVEAVNRIVQEYKGRGHKIYLAGTPVVTHFLKWAMIRDMRKFIAMVIVAVAVLLFLMFRRISGVILPLLIVILSLLSTAAVMAATGTAIKIPTQVLPSFILAVGVGTSVHILTIFYQRLQSGDKKGAAIAGAMGHSGLAVLMTNVTTAAGLISFATADVAPVADLGIFASIGVMLAFVYTVTLLPALLAVIPIQAKGFKRQDRTHDPMERMMSAISTFSTTHPRKILGASALLIIFSAVGVAQIRFSHYPLKWFPPDNLIRTDTETIDANLRGSMTIEAVLDTGEENGWYDPDRLRRLEAATPAMESLRHANNYVGKAFSITSILKEINQALNENRSEAYGIPTHRELIAQEFLLFENSGSDDMEDFVDSQFSKVRFTMKFPFKDTVHYKPFQRDIRAYFETTFPDTRLEFTGMISLLARTINNTITSLAKSYATAMVIITILMVLLIGRVRIGLLSMIPNLTPILFMLGIIGWFHFPMDMFTMMVASIAIGLAVDDTIHFMHNFRRYYDLCGDPRQAVFDTLNSTGRAMLVTSVVLSLGFFIYTFATLQNIVRFGFLTGITIIAALLSDYFIAPALMVLVNKKKRPMAAGQ